MSPNSPQIDTVKRVILYLRSATPHVKGNADWFTMLFGQLILSLDRCVAVQHVIQRRAPERGSKRCTNGYRKHAMRPIMVQ